MSEPEPESLLSYAVKAVTRPGVTRDLPHGPEDLLWVANTSTLIYGESDAVLVDTFTTIEQNDELVEWVKSFDRNLTHVYITHGHGDHLFGIGQLLNAFPGAKAIGTAERWRTPRSTTSPPTAKASGSCCSRTNPNDGLPAGPRSRQLRAGGTPARCHRRRPHRHRPLNQSRGARPAPHRRRGRGLQRHTPVHDRIHYRIARTLGPRRRASRRIRSRRGHRRPQEARTTRSPSHDRANRAVPTRLQPARSPNSNGTRTLRPDARALPTTSEPGITLGRRKSRETPAMTTPRSSPADP